jgi:hypothetical protein
MEEPEMGILFVLHSYLRWIILLIALIAAVKFASGWLQKQKPAAMDRGLMSGFSGLMDLQALLGIVFLAVSNDFSMPRLEHAGTMIVAAVVAHLPMRWRNADSALVLRNNLFVILAVLALVILGITSLGGGTANWQLRVP